MFRAGSNRSRPRHRSRPHDGAPRAARSGAPARRRTMALRSAAIRSRLTAHARLSPSCRVVRAGRRRRRVPGRVGVPEVRAHRGGRLRADGRHVVVDAGGRRDPGRAHLQSGGRSGELSRVPLGGRRRFGPQRRRRFARLGGALRAGGRGAGDDRRHPVADQPQSPGGHGGPRHGGRHRSTRRSAATPSGSRRRPPRPRGLAAVTDVGQSTWTTSYRFGAELEEQCDEAFRR